MRLICIILLLVFVIGAKCFVLNEEELDGITVRHRRSLNDWKEKKDRVKEDFKSIKKQWKEKKQLIKKTLNINFDSLQRINCFISPTAFEDNAFELNSTQFEKCTSLIYYVNITTTSELQQLNPSLDAIAFDAMRESRNATNHTQTLLLTTSEDFYSQKEDYYQIWSEIVQSNETRSRFIVNVIEYLENNGFNGFIVDWQSRDLTNSTKLAIDTQGITSLIQEMHPVFVDDDSVLGLSVSGNVNVFNIINYNSKELVKNVDFIDVMTHGYVSKNQTNAGHHTVMKTIYSDEDPNQSVMAGLSVWLKENPMPNKLNIVIAAFGVVQQLDIQSNQSRTSIPSQTELSQVKYNELCMKFNQTGNGTDYRSITQWQAPILIDNGKWISFDNTLSLKLKIKYAKLRKLGGVSLQFIDYDDYRGSCETGSSPLLNVIIKEVAAVRKTDDSKNGAEAMSTTSIMAIVGLMIIYRLID